MSWKYPTSPIKTGHVIDNIAINDNFLSVTEEATGYLNEHNFDASDYIVSRADLQPGYALKLFYSRPDPAAAPNSNTVPRGSTVPSEWVRLNGASQYQTFAKKGLSLTFTSRGGPTWLCGSFTLHNHVIPRPSSTKPSDYTTTGLLSKRKGFGFNAAIELDGIILNESLIGSGDPMNDYFDNESNTTDDGITAFPKGGGGVQGAVNALVVDTVVDLVPGTHTIRIAVLDIRGSNGRDKDMPAISSRELFALELTR